MPKLKKGQKVMTFITYTTLGKCIRPHSHSSYKQGPSANHDSHSGSTAQPSTGPHLGYAWDRNGKKIRLSTAVSTALTMSLPVFIHPFSFLKMSLHDSLWNNGYLEK
jgi:hypothetical protein